ncbi:hypothetical protein [Lentzea kentuckyensis]|uniref:hypothetical protein n=1 Tax=Lentzea kentuckyensis TaxID=360086 RepID=UPI000A3A0A1B|nr:hypothetical protein [Lentzea kentuckyensis]
MITVLLVDSEPRTARALQNKLSANGYEVLIAQGNRTAVDLAAEHDPEVLSLVDGVPVARRESRPHRNQSRDRISGVIADLHHGHRRRGGGRVA